MAPKIYKIFDVLKQFGSQIRGQSFELFKS